jgi:hypothetical protein
MMKWTILGIGSGAALLACNEGSGGTMPISADAGSDTGAAGVRAEFDARAPMAPMAGNGGGGAGGSAATALCRPKRVGAGDQPLIDDFEDGDTFLPETDGRRGPEFSFTEPAGSVQFSVVDGAGPGGSRALRFAGSASIPGGTGYVLQLNNDYTTICPFDASSYQGLEFWGRSELLQETVAVHVRVAANETCHDTDPIWECFDSYIATVSLGLDWQRHVLPWTAFVGFFGGPQPNAEVPANLANLYEIQFAPQTNLGGFAVLLDDIQFVSGSCGSSVCDLDRPCPADCCGNETCEPFERGRFSEPLDESGARSGMGLLHCAADCALPSSECPGFDLGNFVPQSVSGNTALSASVFDGSCAESAGPLPAPEATFSFTAPDTGNYLFDTRGSAFPSVVYVLDALCAGEELACGNGRPGFGAPSVSVALAANQTVTVVVDGSLGARGDFNLNVSRLDGTCPEEDLGSSVPSQASASTVGAGDSSVSSCGLFDRPDRTHLFSALEAGVYSFSAAADFDTVISVRDSGCGGRELACGRGSSFGGARVARELSAGQAVAISVEGVFDDGDYTLDVDRLLCPQSDLGSQLPLSFGGSFDGDVNASAGSCGGDFGGDVAMTWTAPVAGSYVFDTLGSSFDTLLYLIAGSSCSGPSLVCNDDALGGLQSQVVLQLDEGQLVTIVIDSFGNTGTFTLNINDANAAGADAGAPNAAP